MNKRNYHGKGNVKAQKKRRRQRLKDAQRCETSVLLIDGNWSYYPVAYCTRYHAYLTQGLIDTHRCVYRGCPRFRKIKS